MSDHVTHRIVFDARHAESILSKIGNGTFDFNYFVPQPKHLYTGTIRSEEDAIDFPCNQSSWYLENWGDTL